MLEAISEQLVHVDHILEFVVQSPRLDFDPTEPLRRYLGGSWSA